MDLKEADILGDELSRHWYYVSKGRALTSLLGDRHFDEVVDVGAGSGVFSRQLLDSDICDRANCVDTSYPADSDDVHNGKPLLMRRSAEGAAPSLLLMMDVLEHVDDDLGLLRNYTDGMPSGGLVFITVPAFQFLWSGHDVFLEHYRRYTLPQVEALITAGGLEPVRGRYFFGLLFPVAALLRLWDRVKAGRPGSTPKSALRRSPAWLNRLLIWIHDVERLSLFRINRLAGLSVVFLARKP